MKIAGLDIGSSSIKGAVLNLEHHQIEQVVRKPFPNPISGLPAGHFEIDPNRVFSLTQKLLEELLVQAPDCQAIVPCGQMGGVVLADNKGNPMGNYVSWQDQRSLENDQTGTTVYESTCQRLDGQTLGRLGYELKPGTAPAILSWMSNKGELGESATALTLGDFVMARLCNAVPCTEYTNALGALDVSTRDWSAELLESLQPNNLQWPSLRQFDQPVGEFSFSGGSIPCYPVVGDHQCALAGALLTKGELSLNVSTGSQVSMLACNFQEGNYQIRPWFGDGLLNTITHIPAGRSLNVLVNLVTEMVLDNQDPWSYILRAASEAEENDLVVDLGFFDGPMGNQGGIANIRVDNLDVGSLFRTGFRTMASYYKECANRLSPSRDWKRIAFSGGLVQNIPMLRDFIVESLSSPYRVCRSEEDTLEGLLILGKVIAGEFDSVDEGIADRLEYNHE